jgi:hypothetical protein
MMFRTVIAAVASAAFISQGALAQLTVPLIVTNVGIVTTVSANANNALSQITTSSTPSEVEATAKVSREHMTRRILTLCLNQALGDAFNTIINDIAGDTTAMQATPPFDDCAGSQAIVTALSSVSNHSLYNLYTISHLCFVDCP